MTDLKKIEKEFRKGVGWRPGSRRRPSAWPGPVPRTVTSRETGAAALGSLASVKPRRPVKAVQPRQGASQVLSRAVRSPGWGRRAASLGGGLAGRAGGESVENSRAVTGRGQNECASPTAGSDSAAVGGPPRCWTGGHIPNPPDTGGSVIPGQSSRCAPRQGSVRSKLSRAVSVLDRLSHRPIVELPDVSHRSSAGVLQLITRSIHFS